MRVLAISAHPDDETLGCGGTLLKHRAAGDDLFWLVATQAYQPSCTPELIARKAEEVAGVAEAYGMQRVFKLGLPSLRLHTIPQNELFGRIREVIEAVKPETVCLVHEADVALDHEVLFRTTMAVLKPSHMAGFGVRRILAFEVLSSTEAAPPRPGRAFVPTVFSDITPFMERKIEIMQLYATELQPDPYPRGLRGLRALAAYRGATIGVEYAEAFMLVRELMA